MQKNSAKTACIATGVILILSLFSCSDTKPKVLGDRGALDFTSNNTSSQETFKFNFAYRDTAAAAPLDKLIYLQGASNTKTTMISTCNTVGTNCVCEFLDAAGNELEESDSTEISYDSTGNYFRCEFDGTLANLSSIRIRNQNSTVTSTIYTVETTLTAQKLIGDELDANRIRTIYRFTCLFNYLQKQGTSSTSFDCSDQASQCWNTGGSSGDFCLLQSRFPYFLFSDNLTTNFTQKPADKLYNQGTDSKICGVQVKQYDCAGSAGTPQAVFAIFADQVGIFETSVQLGAGPDISLVSYGFAAKTSTFNGNTVCPPGMERRVFYRTLTDSSGTGVSSNYSNALQLSDIGVPATAPAAVAVNKVEGGDCGGSSCTLPTTAAGTIKSFNYSSTGETEFCVIPASLLP